MIDIDKNVIAEAKSTLREYRKGSDSARTVLPQIIRQLLKANPGDTLNWKGFTYNDESYVIVKKVESE